MPETTKMLECLKDFLTVAAVYLVFSTVLYSFFWFMPVEGVPEVCALADTACAYRNFILEDAQRDGNYFRFGFLLIAGCVVYVRRNWDFLMESD